MSNNIGVVTLGATTRALRMLVSEGATGTDQGDGTKAFKQADLSTITFEIVPRSTMVKIAGPTALVISNVVFDTPFTEKGVTANFAYDFPPGTFPVIGETYDILIKFVTTGGDVGINKQTVFVDDSKYT